MKGIPFSDVKEAMDSSSVKAGWRAIDNEVLVCSDSAQSAMEVIDRMVSVSQYPQQGNLLTSFQLKATKSNSTWTLLVIELEPFNIHLEADYKSSKINWACPSDESKAIITARIDSFFASLPAPTCSVPFYTANLKKLYQLNKDKINASCQLSGFEAVSVSIRGQSFCLSSYSEQSLNHACKYFENLKVFSKKFSVKVALVEWLMTSIGHSKLKGIADEYQVMAEVNFQPSTNAERSKIKNVYGDVLQMAVRSIFVTSCPSINCCSVNFLINK